MQPLPLTWIPIEDSLRRGTGSVLGSSATEWPPVLTGSFCNSLDDSGESTTAAGTCVSRQVSTEKWGRDPLLRLLSEELLLFWLLWSWPSGYPSCADSVLLCTVTEMKGLEVAVRGGTGGGGVTFLHVVIHVETADRSDGERTRH